MIGLVVLALGILIEVVGIVPPIRAVLRLPIPMALSGSVGAVMIVLGAIFMGAGI